MTRQRLTYSILLAVLIHAAVLLLVQMFVHFGSRRVPEYGPLIVTLEETSPAPVLERQQERQPQPEVQPQPRTEPQSQPRPAPATRREEPAVPSQPRTQAPAAPAQRAKTPTGPQTAPRVEPQPVPQPAARTEPERPPQGSRQIVPAEPLGTLPPVAPEESTPYQPQTFSQPLTEQGPVQAAPSQEQSPRLDTSRLDSAIAQSDTDRPPAAQAGPSGSSTGRTGTAQTSIEGFQIEWQDPSQGRQVMQSDQPSIPAWVSEQGLRLQVAISFDLGPSGYLSNIRVARSSGYPDVDSAVMAALRRWRFSASPGAGNVRGEVTYRIIPR